MLFSLKLLNVTIKHSLKLRDLYFCFFFRFYIQLHLCITLFIAAWFWIKLGLKVEPVSKQNVMVIYGYFSI